MKTENAAVIDQNSIEEEKRLHDERHTPAGKHTGDEKHGDNLLEHIRNMRMGVGDELTDEEFTHLVREAKPPKQAGFTFLSFCSRFVLFSVPKQDCGNWYQEKGWIKPEKEEIVKKIGEKYGFSFCEPPDTKTSSSDAPNPHHHMQL